MAQRTQVLFIDDMDGSAADETVAFGLDGSTYEIDLSDANAKQLRESLADYVAHGRSASAIRTTRRRRAAVAPVAPDSSSPDTAQVRSWARSNGYAVSHRGPISSEVLEAFGAAH